MGTKSKELTTTRINSLKPKDKAYAITDGRGLHILIKPNGSKLWEFNFVCPLDGKRKKTSLGLYPDVTLKHARDKRDERRRLVANGINPIKHFQKIKQDKQNENAGIFEKVVKEWLDTKQREVVEGIIVEKTYQRIESLLINDTVPFFKSVSESKIKPILLNANIKDIKHSHLVTVIEAKNKTAPVSAKRLLQYFNRLWLYATSKGYCDFNVVANIDKVSHITKTKVSHYAKITDINVLGELVNAIYNYNGHISTRNILKLVLHVPLRATNLVTLQWKYIDFDKKLLTIPRAEMKVKDENLEDFTMPLSDEVIKILKEQKQFTRNKKYVFVSDYGEHINAETPNRALQRMGFNDEKRERRQRTHSFRGTFRSLADTYQLKHNAIFEVKEIALDHRVGNSVTQSYSHKANYEEQLRKLMRWWSKFIVDMLD